MDSAYKQQPRSHSLFSGDEWLRNGSNILLLGPPGGGKLHLLSAICPALLNEDWRVLFELIGTRDERRSMIITANQPFEEWLIGHVLLGRCWIAVRQCRH